MESRAADVIFALEIEWIMETCSRRFQASLSKVYQNFKISFVYFVEFKFNSRVRGKLCVIFNFSVGQTKASKIYQKFNANSVQDKLSKIIFQLSTLLLRLLILMLSHFSTSHISNVIITAKIVVSRKFYHVLQNPQHSTRNFRLNAMS